MASSDKRRHRRPVRSSNCSPNRNANAAASPTARSLQTELEQAATPHQPHRPSRGSSRSVPPSHTPPTTPRRRAQQNTLPSSSSANEELSSRAQLLLTGRASRQCSPQRTPRPTTIQDLLRTSTDEMNAQPPSPQRAADVQRPVTQPSMRIHDGSRGRISSFGASLSHLHLPPHTLSQRAMSARSTAARRPPPDLPSTRPPPEVALLHTPVRSTQPLPLATDVARPVTAATTSAAPSTPAAPHTAISTPSAAPSSAAASSAAVRAGPSTPAPRTERVGASPTSSQTRVRELKERRRRELYAWNEKLRAQTMGTGDAMPLDAGAVEVPHLRRTTAPPLPTEEVIRIADDVDDASGASEVGARPREEVRSDDVALYASELAAPAMATDYLTALMSSDPRVAFEFLHNGAMSCMEEMEGIAPTLMPTASGTSMTCTTLGGVVQFRVVPLHDQIASRAPLEREDAVVDELVHDGTREKILDVLGTDLTHALRRTNVIGL